MARQTSSRSGKRSPRRPPQGQRRGLGLLLLGVVLGLSFAALALFLYRRSEHSADRRPLSAAASSEPPATPLSPASPHTNSPPHPSTPTSAANPEAPPFPASEDVFEAGARLYGQRCASCHGTPAQSSLSHPATIQFWNPNRPGDDTGTGRRRPARIYQQIANGAVSAGMPAYQGVLTRTQIWQLSLLLSSAGQEMPDPVEHLLNTANPR